MTKTIYKIIPVLALTGLVLTPVVASAEKLGVAGNYTVKQSGSKGQLVCGRISQIEARVKETRANRFSKVTARWSERAKNLEEKIQEQDKKMEGRRAKWETYRNEAFAKLEEKAKTDEQKAAVTVCQTAVKEAVATRQAAVDTARNRYREAVAQRIQERESEIKKAYEDFNTAADAAFSKAKANCKDGDSVLVTLKEDLAKARATFRTQIENTERVRGNVDDLKATRKTAIDKAIADFKTSMEKAREELKKVLGE
jgi:hypothetical protein